MEIHLFVIALLLLLFFQTSFSTDIFHLQGYAILADPLNAQQALNEMECGDACVATGANCIGFEYSDNECQLLTQIRNIIVDNSSCFYYVVDRRDEQSGSQKMAQLDITGQLVYSNAYGNSPCPQGFSDDTTSCSLATDETKCNEYADFFNATFDGTDCIINTDRPLWYCAPKTDPIAKTLFSKPSFGFCYFKINASETTSIATFNQQCQSASSKSSLLSICSREENDFVASIASDWPTFLSLYISASQASRVYNWYDSSIAGYCGYRNWQIGNSTDSSDGEEPNDYTANTETIVGMQDDEFWYDFTEATTTSETIICKENALTLAEYVSQCQSLDNCEQLN